MFYHGLQHGNIEIMVMLWHHDTCSVQTKMINIFDDGRYLRIFCISWRVWKGHRQVNKKPCHVTTNET